MYREQPGKTADKKISTRKRTVHYSPFNYNSILLHPVSDDPDHTAILNSALDLAGSKAAGADVHSLLSAVDVHSNLLDIGIPDSVGSSMRMADVISKMSALAADITFCHLKHLLTYIFGSTTFV